MMPFFEVEGPDGKVYEVDAPDADSAVHAIKTIGSAPQSQEPPAATGREQRGLILPFVTDAQGKTTVGVPDILHAPYMAAKRMLTGETTPQTITGADVLALGGIAPTPSVAGLGVAGRPVARAATTTAAEAAPAAARAPVNIADAGVAARNRAVELAGELGVEIPEAAVGGRAKQIVAGSVRDLPVIGDPLVAAAQKATRQLEGRVRGVADELGPSSRAGAGQAVRDEIGGWIETGSGKEAAKLYEPVERIVRDAEAVLDARKIGKQHATQTLDSTRAIVDEIVSLARESKIEPPAIVRRMSAAINSGMGLTYRGLQNLRTQIGDMMSGRITPEPGMDSRALQAIYAGLSKDLEALVQGLGETAYGEAGRKFARRAWEAANAQFAAQIAAKREALAKVVGLKGDAAGEEVIGRIVSYAGAKKGADIVRLHQARSVVGEEAWADMAGAALRGMGQTKDGWSLARWRTEYANLSEPGKLALFGKAHKETLDKVFELGALEERLARIGNPSQSGRLLAVISAPTVAISAPMAFVVSVLGGSLLANALARPATARAVQRTMQAAKAYDSRGSEGARQLLAQSVKMLAAALAAEGEADAGEIERRAADILRKAEAPVRVSTPEEALRLPKGARFIDPDGVQRRNQSPAGPSRQGV